ncbi:Tautomerase-3 domain-containing protein [Fusarium sp. LHS14.1]|nr:Tautomerase-3 domain-containing protein [Fusarium sp. LHS14.1]
MPYYQIYHSYPLDQEQRQSIAASITDLHCKTFITPSFFVHVHFIQEESSAGNYFLAGKPHKTTSNRIIGVVRTSATRPRSAFDELGARIEAAYYEALKIVAPVDKQEWSQEDEKKRLMMVTFVPMVTIREGGMVIPEAGQEGGWLKGQIPFFEQMSSKGIADFTDLMEELKERDDLKKLLQ